MAQGNTPDIRVLVGVDGASIDGKSGALILKELNKVASQIGSKNAPQVAFTVDVAKTTKNIQDQLNAIVKSIQITPLDLNIRANQSSVGTSSNIAKPNVTVHTEEKNILSEIAAQKKKDIELTRQQKKEIQLFISEVGKLNNAEKSLNTSENFTNKLGKPELSNKIVHLREQVVSLNKQVQELFYNTNNGENLGDRLNDKGFKSFSESIKKVNKEVLELQQISTKDSPLFVENERLANQARDVSAFALSLEKFEKTNDKFKGNSGAAAEFERIKAALSDLESRSKLGETVGIELKELIADTNRWKASLEKAGLSGQTWFGKLQAQMQKLGVYFGASAVMMGAWRQVKQMTTNVIELDKVITDLQIATGSNRQETEKLLSTYSNMGKQLGATTVEVANAADAWLRQGYSIKESNTLIENSMMLSKLGQIDSADATKALTSAMKGYKLSVEDSIGVVDKFTALDMEAAVSAGYIATAMAETSTGARLAGVEMDRLVGYITQVGEVTQDGAESVGVFFKTLFARMGNIKEGKLIDPETQEDISSVEVTLDNLGIKLRENGGEFRNFGTILDEVYSKWDTLGTVNQRALAVAFSGVRNQEKFLTLMDNYGQAMEYAETAANSAGTALDKYENSYLVSVEAAQNRFTAQFEALSKTILESGLITDTYDAGTGILGFFTGLIDKLGTIPTLATVAAGALSAINNKGWLKNLSDKRTYALLRSGGNTERADIFGKRLYNKSLKWCA